MRDADTAMYRRQGARQGPLRAVRRVDARAARSSGSRLEDDLRRAIERGEFIAPLSADRRAEVRASGPASKRCRAGSGPSAQLSPAEFIPIVEEMGLHRPAGRLGDQRGVFARPRCGASAFRTCRRLA